MLLTRLCVRLFRLGTQERRKKTAELLKAVEKERSQAQKLLDIVTAEENEVLVKTDATMVRPHVSAELWSSKCCKFPN